MPRAKGPAKAPNQVGAPTARYPNRTDLAAAHAAGPTQPVRTPTGQGYGEATALAQAQQAAPLPARAPVPTGSSTPAMPAPGPGVPMMPGTLTPVAAQGYTPPNLALSQTPSGRPDEPLTAGLPVGAGPGPNLAAARQFSGAAVLAALAQATGDQNMAQLAEVADRQGF